MGRRRGGGSIQNGHQHRKKMAVAGRCSAKNESMCLDEQQSSSSPALDGPGTKCDASFFPQTGT